ncbi:fumarylacetoacetate hydrolase family protein [Luteimonas sp. BDR2-5]|uniref:fumarylacetoacetate hydrolase family protein n=1 Tax=Proluteimonas luteida TaxID=2878685 RepID=UPI001E62F2D4|nr:fumarylacetoacetate hydrolase family protein [Luteimonas sp. BDR2-5]MCD9027990.1 fumarylacetoacetate hydrolase family protein [Luteimonas sp. BDR2-5]
MKLARFIHDGAPAAIGVVREDGIVPLDAGLAPDGDMSRLIAGWPSLRAPVEARARSGSAVALSAVRLLAPVAAPSKILAIGLNYADHIAETGMQVPAEPLWFAKMPNAVNGPFDPVQVPKVSTQLDHEVELVAVIGRGGRHISCEEAPSRVFGYCVGNDVSVRDWQLRTTQWVVGKSFDGHAPIGPWIVTADELPDPHSLDIRCRVDGELRQSSNTGRLVFDIWAQLAHLSQAMTLQAGDLLFTGTPGGVGVAERPPRWLRPGQRVRCEIDGIGSIENPVSGEE